LFRYKPSSFGWHPETVAYFMWRFDTEENSEGEEEPIIYVWAFSSPSHSSDPYFNLANVCPAFLPLIRYELQLSRVIGRRESSKKAKVSKKKQRYRSGQPGPRRRGIQREGMRRKDQRYRGG
jgi:hypothetical protein